MFRNPTTDLIVVLVIVLLILGPKRLPGLGKSLGQGMREFKEGITGESKDETDKPALTQAGTMPDPTDASGRATEPATAPNQTSTEVGSEHRS
jgi:sec-independent protein translocase protein TatA